MFVTQKKTPLAIKNKNSFSKKDNYDESTSIGFFDSVKGYVYFNYKCRTNLSYGLQGLSFPSFFKNKAI